MPLSIAGRPPPDQAIQVILAALDSGETLIDTADVYCLDQTDIGHNERLVAEALSQWPGEHDSIVVATKGGLVRPGGRWERDGRPDRVKAACERSLTALGLERIDLYQLHAPDPDVPFAESVGALAELRSEGKIRWAGLSNVSVEEIETARGVVPIQSVQNRLNPFFAESPDVGVVNHCTDNNLAFIAYSPVGGGRLNKKLPDHPALEPIAQARGVSAHAVVLAWVLARSPSVIAIPGARTVAHARDAAGAADLELTPEELRAIDEAEFSTA